MEQDEIVVARARLSDEAAVATCLEGLRRDGVAVLEGVLDATAVARAKEALERGAEQDEARGFRVRGSDYDPDDLNLRVGNLPAKDVVFRDMLDLPVVRSLVTGWLGESVRLSNFSSNTTLPGAGAMALHADQNNIPAPWPPYPCGVNLAFALDDFTEDNATRYLPGAYPADGPPAWEGTHPDAVPLCGPAGSVLLMEGRLYHQTGRNTGTTARSGAFAYVVRSFLAPQFSWQRGIPRELRAELSPWLHELLGFGASAAYTQFIPKDGPGTAGR